MPIVLVVGLFYRSCFPDSYKRNLCVLTAMMSCLQAADIAS